MKPKNRTKNGEKKPSRLETQPLPGYRIRAMREAVGLSKAEFARRMDAAELAHWPDDAPDRPEQTGQSLTPTMIGHWEGGLKPVRRGWDRYLVQVIHEAGLRLAKPGVSIKDLISAATDPHASAAWWESLWRGAWVEVGGKCYPVGDYGQWLKAALPVATGSSLPAHVTEPAGPARRLYQAWQGLVKRSGEELLAGCQVGVVYRLCDGVPQAIGPVPAPDQAPLPNPSPERVLQDFAIPAGGKCYVWFGDQELDRLVTEQPITPIKEPTR